MGNLKYRPIEVDITPTQKTYAERPQYKQNKRKRMPDKAHTARYAAELIAKTSCANLLGGNAVRSEETATKNLQHATTQLCTHTHTHSLTNHVDGQPFSILELHNSFIDSLCCPMPFIPLLGSAATIFGLE